MSTYYIKRLKEEIALYERMELPPTSFIDQSCQFARKIYGHSMTCSKGLTQDCMYDNDNGRIQCQNYKNICQMWLKVREKELAHFKERLEFYTSMENNNGE